MADPQNADPLTQDIDDEKTHSAIGHPRGGADIRNLCGDLTPTAAQAGILGKVGGAVKGAAKSVGGAAKTVGKGALHAGTTVGKGIGRDVKRVAVASGKAAVQSPVGQSVKRATGAVRRAAGRI